MCFSISVRRAGAPRPVASNFLERLRRPSGWCNQAEAISETHLSPPSFSDRSSFWDTPPPPSPPRLCRTKPRAGVELVGIEPNPGPPKGTQKKNGRRGQTIQNKTQKAIPVSRPRKPIRSAGESIGSAVGGFLGKAASSLLGSVFGMGDYTVTHNSITGAGGPPQFVNDRSSRSTVISHREYVGDITGSTSFTSTSYAITPTNVALFPWLSQIASNYEEYRIHGMLFEFKTTSGTSVSSTNTALGTVVMATQYNPNDLPFSNKIEMENYEFGTSGAPFENFLHPVECKPSLTVAPQLYVQQPMSANAVSDPRLTSFGNFTIATVGMQATNVIGELWVTYQIELLKPRISSTVSGDGYWYYTNTASLTPGGLTQGASSTSGTLITLPQTNGSASPFASIPLGPASGGGYYNPAANAGLIIAPAFASRTILLTINFTGVGLAGPPLVSLNGNTVAGTQGNIAASGSNSIGTYLLQLPARSGFNALGSSQVAITNPNGTSISRVDITMVVIS